MTENFRCFGQIGGLFNLVKPASCGSLSGHRFRLSLLSGKQPTSLLRNKSVALRVQRHARSTVLAWPTCSRGRLPLPGAAELGHQHIGPAAGPGPLPGRVQLGHEDVGLGAGSRHRLAAECHRAAEEAGEESVAGRIGGNGRCTVKAGVTGLDGRATWPRWG